MPQNGKDTVSSLYELYEKPLWHQAFGILGDVHLSEDAVQETFLRLIRHRDKLCDTLSASVRSYVFKTGKSVALDIYRKNKKHKDALCPMDDGFERIGEHESLDTGAVFEALSRLPKKYYYIIKLTLICSFSTREASAILKISESCARKRLERGKKALRKLLEEDKK